MVQKKFTEAVVALDRANDLMPGAAVGLRAYVDAQSGDRQAALNVLGQLTAAANSGRGTALDLAVAYVGLGDKDGAFEALNRACDRRMPLIEQLKAEPIFDPLRSDPRYPLLLRRMNLARPNFGVAAFGRESRIGGFAAREAKADVRAHTARANARKETTTVKKT